MRLRYVAEHAGDDTALASEALRLAREEALRGENTRAYLEICEAAGAEPNTAWVQTTDQRAAPRHERLNQELQISKNNLIKGLQSLL